MQIGVIYPQTELATDPDTVRAYVRLVEELGYQHVAIYDHVLGADPALHAGWQGRYNVDTTFHEPLVFYGFLAAITDLEQLKNHPAVAKLIAWDSSAVEGAKFDRDEMSIYVERSLIRDACILLRDDADCPFNFLADVTCVDWFPSEPRFEVVYHLLSIPKKERVRLKVRLDGGSPALDSVTLVWPAANYFEREVYDLFGVRFAGHPYLRRLLMPEDWEGYPLRKDYPVEGYR